MSNLNDIYTANPLISIPLDALVYILDNPGETGGNNDAGINANDLLAQIIGTRKDGIRLIWNSATSITVGRGLAVAENRDVINITSAIVKSSLSLSASTWYHIYVYMSDGSPAAEIVTTAPTVWKGTAYSKTGDTSRCYVGSLLTDGSGNIYQFTHNPKTNFIRYVANSLLASPFRVLDTGTATSATGVPCSGIVPITATQALVRIYVSISPKLYIGYSNLSTSVYSLAFPSIDDILSVYTDIPLAGQAFYYMFEGANNGCWIDVNGYYFDR